MISAEEAAARAEEERERQRKKKAGKEIFVAPYHCLLGVLDRNDGTYVVATMNPKLRASVEKRAKYPVVRIAQGALVICPPADRATAPPTHKAIVSKAVDSQEKKRVNAMAKRLGLPMIGEGQPQVGKKRKRKGPNPLSCKKRKVENSTAENAKHKKPRRKRKKKSTGQEQSAGSE
eukprot:TRINITY_DN3426_c1_g1_i1.p2 TRINITY_DN3426_c1_g1~~TRINITY_DN3426_c1_g1_i1.p2  ORF type:complete len:176 (+),score=74.24 TRINITY_DN3426_c1_g1_i1:260-787(+)